MIEIYRKGFRLDIPPEQVVTFKKAQNLNGIQARYAYSNTVSAELTANNRKLLELFDLPTSKASSLMNGFTVDVVLNGSIHLKNQTLNIQKENKKTVDLYLLYADNALIVKLKEQYMNLITSDFLYKKNIADFSAFHYGTTYRTAFVETQEKSRLYVVEEMPVLLQIQNLVRRMFETNGYGVYGDFFSTTNTIKEYYIAPNQGVYQVYSGTGPGFAPAFSSDIDLFTFFTQTMQFFNCYATVDDTYRTVTINQWANLGTFKTGYIDYSKYFADYKDFAFQSKLAKTNKLTYADSGTAFNSFFSNTLSSQKEATYLASGFGAGTLNIFDDSEVDPETGLIELRPDGAIGESSAIRIMKINDATAVNLMYVAGAPVSTSGPSAKPVSMRDVYTEFHKDYTEFILTPLIQNLTFRYDAILAATFSMTRVFFIEQQSSYWIPLELNFSTKKDEITVKAMLIKKRKIPAPILYDFNSIILDFKEKGVFALENLLAMYPMPPNQFPIQDLIIKSYDDTKNRLYINDVFIPSAGLPQAFPQNTLLSIKIEANAPGDVTPDTNTSPIYIQVVDTNGGVSNEAFINVKHTGVARLESNFVQLTEYGYNRAGFDEGHVYVSPCSWVNLGLKPELNNTISSAVMVARDDAADDTFNLVVAAEEYANVKVKVPKVDVFMSTDNNGLGRAQARCRLVLSLPSGDVVMAETSVSNNNSMSATLSGEYVIPAYHIGDKIRAYLQFDFDNTRGSNLGSMDVILTVNNMSVIVSTIKTV
jgi:hypothetical protein